MKKELKELISYILVGGCTTIVNFIIYWLVIVVIQLGWLSANILSWIGAVMFAYWANKHFVFKSVNEIGKEAYQFFMLRLGTLIVESVLLYGFIHLLCVDVMLSKLIVSVITVISNYGLCKFKIFVVKGDCGYGQN